jgi:DNA-binding MarR family transcriptional regulator
MTELDRRARFYKLTKAGRRKLADEVEGFQRFVAAVSPILLARSR